jgi:2,3-bisphosphoglycerate-dependent phosphoglycerate mutase
MATPQSIYHITLLRHGESVGNAQGYHQGQADFPLTDRGKEQTRALAARWLAEGITFNQVISSTLSRARQTAEILSEALQLPVEFDPVWMERNNGALAGLRPEDAAQIYPRPKFIHPYLPIGGTGESQMELYLRAGNAMQSLICRTPGRYLVVSHGGLLNMVLYAILGIVPQANFQGAHFRFRNTAFATLLYRPEEHYWVLERLNDREHWRETGE